MYEISLNFGPFVLLDLQECTVLQKINTHGILEFSGMIQQENLSRYLELVACETSVTCVLKDQYDEEKIVFSGILTDFKVDIEGGLCVLHAVVQTETYLLEQRKHIRTFQSNQIIYSEIINICLDDYSNSNCMIHVPDKPIERMVVQYEETDWEFLQRLASHHHTVIVPESRVLGVKIHFGFPFSKSPIVLDTSRYSVKKDLKSYYFKVAQGLSIQEWDELVYLYESRELYQLGASVYLNGIALYVTQIESKLIGAELLHRYEMRTKDGLQTPKQYNERIAGVSLGGTILEVERDVATIRLEADENKNCGVTWLTYATVYSSENGAGFYCMPEPGDRVRLYFPSEDESSGYIMNATHIGQGGRTRLDPDNKSILTKHGKQLLLTPTSITMTNNQGMSIVLDDHVGISIESDQTITMHSEENIEIVSGSGVVSIGAKQEISLNQGENAVMITDDVSFSGTEIYMG